MLQRAPTAGPLGCCDAEKPADMGGLAEPADASAFLTSPRETAAATTRWIGKFLHGCCIELGNDLPRRALRREKPKPGSVGKRRPAKGRDDATRRWPSAARMNSTDGATISCSRGGGLHFKTDTKLYRRAEAPAFGLQSKTNSTVAWR